MKTKWISLLLCLVCAFAFVGCGDNSQPSAPTTPTQPTTPEQPETPTTPQEPETPTTPQEPTTPETPTTPEDPEKPDPEIPDPTPEDPAPVTDAELIAALEQYCKDGIYKKCLIGLTNDETYVSNKIWYITTDTNDKIVCAELIFYYSQADNSEYFMIGKVVFENPIEKSALKDGKIGNVTYPFSPFTFNYNPTIQQERAELTDAICDTLFDAKTNATRYIVEHTGTTDPTLGMRASRFSVVEIYENNIWEISINLKEASTDTQLITNLQNTAYYRTYDEKSYTITGKKLIANS